jgi:hypothetical protein
MRQKHNIVSYCSENYIECFNLTVPTWVGSADSIRVFTDSDKLAKEGFKHESINVFKLSEEIVHSANWHVCTGRKITAVKNALELEPMVLGNNTLTYLDIDCIVRKKDFSLAVHDNKADILFNRIVYRRDKAGEREANSGVFLMRANRRVLGFVEEWEELAKKYKSHPKFMNYHEQNAFSHLCLEGFDGIKPYSCGVISERIYNMENDDHKVLLEWVKKYDPKIVHLKQQAWKKRDLVESLLP